MPPAAQHCQSWKSSPAPDIDLIDASESDAITIGPCGAEGRTGMSVLMSTHTLATAEEISHRVGIMSHGKLLFDGTITELRQRFPGGQQSLEAMYLAMTEGPPQALGPANAQSN